MAATAQHMARDQHGQTWHALGPHPRKELLARLDRKHATRIYRDGPDGAAVHIGWAIAGHWLSVYRVLPLGGGA